MPRPAGSQSDAAIIRAVEQNRYRVTVGDVAAATGLAVWQVERGLLALAAAGGGHLQVADDGEIAYLFPRNLRAIQLGRQGWGWLRRGLGALWKLFLYLLRISFGIILIGLIAAVFIALTMAICMMSKAGSDGDSDISFDSSFSFIPGFFGDFFQYPPGSSQGSRRQSAKRGRRQSEKRIRKTQADSTGRDYNFFEAIFSFLFGDGNPNADLEERRWQAIASAIRAQHGVLLAEQLTPFLDQLHGDPRDEEYVLPTLVRFNGKPHVSPEGEIIYAFPDLQATAGDPDEDAPPADLPSFEGSVNHPTASHAERPTGNPPAPFLREQSWRFSRASQSQQILAGVLGGVLLIASLSLATVVSLHASVLTSWMALFSGLATAGIGYSMAFLLVPLVRYLWLVKRNKAVTERNAMRRERALQLQQRSPMMKAKLAYALRYAEQRRVNPSDLAYTSEKDLLTQEAENSTKVDAEWQRRLKQSRQYRM